MCDAIRPGYDTQIQTSGTTIIQYTAVIIAYRQPQLLAAVLAGLADQTLPPRAVVVVDNGGTLTADVLASFPLAERTRLVPRPDNPGYAAAVNELSGTDAEALLVLTHDAEFDDALAAELIGALESEPQAGAAAPVLRWVSNPDSIFSAGGYLTPGGRGGHLTAVRSNRPYAVDWVDGAIVMYRTTALDAIGWLSEDYFLYFEDVDTAWRMARAGLSTLVVPTALARQQPGAHPLRLGIRNMTLFARRAGINPVRQTLAVARRVAEESASSILRGRRPQPLQAWRGWREGLRGITGKPEYHG